ncbi:hypothetical protein [Massilia sp. TS11]|uniref:hypothetical protein n=1 Tax=Massilia sp. TS11 TaxID=2908003 RepID=UPI001EDAFA72|nr:hypothetical protein [Massilia sp. TS11]MCG2586526.1 hypothetical protein [Massilia sp. TS11]
MTKDADDLPSANKTRAFLAAFGRDDPELSSFTQNLQILESLIFQSETELASDPPDTRRIFIFANDISSLHAEVKAQFDRAIDRFGADHDLVLRVVRAALRIRALGDATRRLADSIDAGLDPDEIQALLKQGAELVRSGEPAPDVMTRLYRSAIAAKAGLGGGSRPPVDSGGEGSDDDRMNERIKRLEDIAEKTTERLASVAQDVAVIKSNYATREDIAALRREIAEKFGELSGQARDVRTEMHKNFHGITWKFGLAMVGLLAAMAKGFHWI